MNVDTPVSLAIAILCVLAVGISATTLESSLTTDPDDVIDVEWDELPISQDDAAAIESEMQASEESEVQPSGGEASQADQSQSANADEQEHAESSAEAQQPQSQQDQQWTDPPPQMLNFWEKLLILLRDLLPWFLGLGALVAVGTVAYRYRERLLALVMLLAARRSGDRSGDSSSWLPSDPATEIDRLWLAVVRQLDLEDPETTTVTEASNRAVEVGLDPDGVTELADVFEEVRYGEYPASEERQRRARESYRTLDLDEDERSARSDRDGRGDRSNGGEIR